MATLTVVKDLNVFKDRAAGVLARCEAAFLISSVLIEEKKLSTTALSQQLPLRLMLTWDWHLGLPGHGQCARPGAVTGCRYITLWMPAPRRRLLLALPYGHVKSV